MRACLAFAAGVGTCTVGLADVENGDGHERGRTGIGMARLCSLLLAVVQSGWIERQTRQTIFVMAMGGSKYSLTHACGRTYL